MSPDPELDARAGGIDDLILQIKETADKLKRDGASRGDVKLLATALKELRYSLKVFSPLRQRRKVTVYGSARTPPDDPAYLAAVDFGQKMSAAGYLIITGAASGIMEAGHRGAGREHSVGVNILLPFEQSANPIIAGDAKLMHLKYFFTRKLLFVKECDAVALFPGGFGTHDEGFEVLTLIQTGKSHLFPIVCIDAPGGDYWRDWDAYIRKHLLDKRMICPEDLSLYKIADTVEDGVAEVLNFYRVYHSMRYVKGELVLRLKRAPGEEMLDRIHADFGKILAGGRFHVGEPLPAEANEPHLANLPRLRFRFDRRSHGRLRQLIDLLNRELG